MAEQLLALIDARGQHYPLRSSRLVGGRSRECDLFIDDLEISRRHFLIRRAEEGWTIEDLESSNGTFLNGSRLSPRQRWPLALHDTVRVGCTSLTVMAAPTANPASSAPHAPGPSRPASAAPNVPLPLARQTGMSAVPPVAVWLAWAIVAAGVILIAAGSLSPWVRVDVRLSVPLPVIGFSGTVASFVLAGTDAYGRLTLAVAVGLVLLLALDLALRWDRHWAPGLSYLLGAGLPAVIMVNDMTRLNQLGLKREYLGADVLRILQFAENLVGATPVPLAGLYLTGIGLGMAVLGGVLRLLSPLLWPT